MDGELLPALLPCPFCGSTYARILPNHIGDYYVVCHSDELEDPQCGASTSDHNCESQQAAADRWNKRVNFRKLAPDAEVYFSR
jgi:hypothetical protein